MPHQAGAHQERHIGDGIEENVPEEPQGKAGVIEFPAELWEGQA